MKVHILRAALFAAIIVMLAPFAAHAQETNDCEVYYCSAWGYLSGGQVSGYAEYYDDTEDVLLGIETCVVDPYGNNYGCTDDAEYDDAIADATYTANSNGAWLIIGWPWYDDESGDGGGSGDDGPVYYEVDVLEVPTSETTTWNMSLTGDPGIGEQFAVQLNPTTFNFDGYTLTESFSSPYDWCFLDWGVGVSGAVHITGISAGMATVSGANVFGDRIYAPANWVDYYTPLVYPTYCGVTTNQSMFMPYSMYAYVLNSIEIDVYSYQTCSSRAGVAGCH